MWAFTELLPRQRRSTLTIAYWCMQCEGYVRMGRVRGGIFQVCAVETTSVASIDASDRYKPSLLV